MHRAYGTKYYIIFCITYHKVKQKHVPCVGNYIDPRVFVQQEQNNISDRVVVCGSQWKTASSTGGLSDRVVVCGTGKRVVDGSLILLVYRGETISSSVPACFCSSSQF